VDWKKYGRKKKRRSIRLYYGACRVTMINVHLGPCFSVCVLYFYALFVLLVRKMLYSTILPLLEGLFNILPFLGFHNLLLPPIDGRIWKTMEDIGRRFLPYLGLPLFFQ